MSSPKLALKGVHTHIGLYHILQGVDLEVEVGSVTLLLGRNGAGKTTTLRTIMGLWRCSSGSVIYSDDDITNWPTSEIAKRGIAYVPESMGIFPDLTIRENILLAARKVSRARDLDQARLEWIFELFPPVHRFWNKSAGTLSGGQKQMVAVARAIVEPRNLLLIDEPSKGLAPSIVDNMSTALHQLKQAGVTILLVEQNLRFCEGLGDHVAIIDNGRTIYAAPSQEWFSDKQLQKAHMGLAL